MQRIFQDVAGQIRRLCELSESERNVLQLLLPAATERIDDVPEAPEPFLFDFGKVAVFLMKRRAVFDEQINYTVGNNSNWLAVHRAVARGL